MTDIIKKEGAESGDFVRITISCLDILKRRTVHCITVMMQSASL